MEPEENSRSAELAGEVSAVIFRNPESGFTIAALTDDQGRSHTFCGVFPDLSPGLPVKLRGAWEQTAYGLRLKVETFEYLLPTTPDGVERFLGSGLIPGVGPKLARSIVAYFGDRTIEILDSKPGRLREIKKIGAKKASQIAEGWRKATADREQFIFLQGLGLTPNFVRKLIDRYGRAAAQTVKGNPYKLAEDLDGVGFLKADKIATELGVAADAPVRMLAGLVHCMNNLTSQGHCSYPREPLLREAASLLGCTPEQLIPALETAVASRQLAVAGDMIYPMRLYLAENELPRHVERLLAAAPDFPAAKIAQIQPDARLSLNRQQLRAIEMAAAHPVTIITGGPGVGKTTVLGELVRRAKAAKLNVMLTAPTGRAAKRMAEATGHAAKTIHRLLAFDPATGGFQHGVFDPLDCDLLIVDESSMLDLPLALALFQALKKGAAAVLVGDADQLPSVGPGTVLASFISCERFPVTRLTEVFRQGAGSRIVANAHRVNAGLLPQSGGGEALSDFYWIESDEERHTLDLIEKLTCDRIPSRFGLDPARDVQIISPMNRGWCGTAALNAMMQQLLNPGGTPEIGRGAISFRIGDKVMQIINNYDKNVYNGDSGLVAMIDESNRALQVMFDGGERTVSYEADELDQLTLAYAITVHKSQGCEFPAVILPLMPQHYMMLQRNLLYTAMTRARKLLILIGSEKTVRMAVDNARLAPRYSNLGAALTQIRA